MEIEHIKFRGLLFRGWGVCDRAWQEHTWMWPESVRHFGGKFHHVWKGIIHLWLDRFQWFRQNIYLLGLGILYCYRILMCVFTERHRKDGSSVKLEILGKHETNQWSYSILNASGKIIFGHILAWWNGITGLQLNCKLKWKGRPSKEGPVGFSRPNGQWVQMAGSESGRGTSWDDTWLSRTWVQSE